MWDAIIITPFINVMLWIYSLVGNLGIAIILFTLLTRVLLHPLMVKQIRGSQAMQTLQGDLRYKEIQEKYKNDKERLAAEQSKLMKEMGVNPFSSCLPTQIQFPIIIGLYQAMIKTIATSPLDLFNLTQHIYPGFLKISELVPLNTQFLWMDMGVPERLYIPGLSFGIPVIAIVVLVTTYIQSKVITPPKTQGSNDQSAMMSNMMNLYMPFLMGWLALTLAAGLSIYFVTSNLIGIAQYALVGKVYWKNLLTLPFGKQKPATITPAEKAKERTKRK
jgi:YidC/Oxa1 family membrane protein insertase